MAEKKFQVPSSRRVRYPHHQWLLGFLLILAMGIFSTPALAHRVLVFAYAEGGVIHTESKFVPNTPLRQSQVRVLEAQTGQVLLTGQTDAQGKFSFKVPAEAAARQADLKIVVEAAMGHQGEWLLKAHSYLPGAKTAAAVAAPPSSAPAAARPAPPPPAGKTAATVDPQLLEDAVNKALERQLAPIKEMLAAAQVRKASLPDIIGGFGYILGLFGLWAYFLSKRKKDS